MTVPDNLIIHFRLTTGMLLRILNKTARWHGGREEVTYGIHNFCGIGSVLDNEKPVVDLCGCGHIPALVLEDKRMSYLMTFLAGGIMGGIFGVFTMCMMIQAGQADDREERWFDGRSDK